VTQGLANFCELLSSCYITVVITEMLSACFRRRAKADQEHERKKHREQNTEHRHRNVGKSVSLREFSVFL